MLYSRKKNNIKGKKCLIFSTASPRAAGRELTQTGVPRSRDHFWPHTGVNSNKNKPHQQDMNFIQPAELAQGQILIALCSVLLWPAAWEHLLMSSVLNDTLFRELSIGFL